MVYVVYVGRRGRSARGAHLAGRRAARRTGLRAGCRTARGARRARGVRNHLVAQLDGTKAGETCTQPFLLRRQAARPIGILTRQPPRVRRAHPLRGERPHGRQLLERLASHAVQRAASDVGRLPLLHCGGLLSLQLSRRLAVLQLPRPRSAQLGAEGGDFGEQARRRLVDPLLYLPCARGGGGHDERAPPRLHFILHLCHRRARGKWGGSGLAPIGRLAVRRERPCESPLPLAELRPHRLAAAKAVDFAFESAQLALHRLPAVDL